MLGKRQLQLVQCIGSLDSKTKSDNKSLITACVLLAVLPSLPLLIYVCVKPIGAGSRRRVVKTSAEKLPSSFFLLSCCEIALPFHQFNV